MPSLRTFRIEFDRSGATYTPGELVTGNVIVDLAREKSIRALKLSIKGEANVSWERRRSNKNSQGHRHTQVDHFRANEQYFNLTYYLFGNTTGNGDVRMPAGFHKYPFNFSLPYNIPCSFEHANGHIRYTTKAVIDRPWRFDHECKIAFTVVSSYDLNAYSQQCSLEFHAKTPYNSTKTDKAVVKGEESRGPFGSYADIVSRLQVPPIPPSQLEYCNIIDQKYILRITIHISGMHCSITKTYPILIGTIPLRSAISSVPYTQTVQPTAPIMQYDDDPPPPMPMSPDYAPPNLPYPYPGPQPTDFASANQPSTSANQWDIPPPSYEECVQRADSIKDDDESNYVHGANEPFAPRYPVFNFPTPYSSPPEK
ncbi:arrestin domain-containing protein 2 isoform X2 [Anoplolepis gracilipes]|uniref:arrestin domain-containing protein 2 isoform X2 n=1 Tax=Anoplolepis gracilipes TaxID=354296 RepID=UPI003BA2118C